MADERRKVWAAILYQESVPSDWKEQLERTHVAIAVSPLHDKDVWTDADEDENPLHVAGTTKKPHWHVVLYFESLKSSQQVVSLLSPLGISYAEPVESPTAYNRYLCHLDNPDKATYDVADVLKLNGAKCDMSKPKPTRDEQRIIRDEILHHIEENNVTEYGELVLYALHIGNDDWAWYIEHNTVYLNALLKSIRHGGISVAKPE